MPPGELTELVHGLLGNAGAGVVIGVDGLARLEVHIWVLGGAADHRVLRREAPGAVRLDQLIAHHAADLLVAEQLDLVDLRRGAEAIEEVQEGHPAFERGGLSDQGKVMRFLHRARSQHGKAG